MSRTNIDIDDELIATAMRQNGLKTKREAVDLALRRLVVPVMTIDEMHAMRGSGWDGDLEALKNDPVEQI